MMQIRTVFNISQMYNSVQDKITLSTIMYMKIRVYTTLATFVSRTCMYATRLSDCREEERQRELERQQRELERLEREKREQEAAEMRRKVGG